jgi:uncharacterized membrane protein
MSAPHANTIVEGYLARLELALAGADPLRRRELVDDVRAHIADARAGLADETDADLLAICDRVGEPAEIAHDVSATVGGGPSEAATTPSYRWSWFEVVAIALTIVAWPVGAILTGLSRVWTRREKVVAIGIGTVTFAIGFPLFAPLIGPILGPAMGSLGPIAPMFMGTLGALPLAAAAYLAYRLTRYESGLSAFA